ncbi:plexin-C1-like [Mobula hypostoma]|uniref:plexin-C1-like n=1 Tax=Mobula hypostoma TaxID=723540 RepID=UPI002FC29739
MYRPKGFRLCLLLLNSLHALSAEPSYRFETDTNNIAVSASDGGRVYVATNNSLYQFNRSLALEMRVSTGPRLDGPCAQSKGCCVPWRYTTNVNRILVVDEKNKHLLTCGTVRGGACELRQLGNISDFKEDIMGRVATQDLRASTVAFPVRFGGKSYVLTAVTATGEDSRFVPQSCVGNSSYYAIDRTQVFQRLLEGSDFLHYDISFEEPIAYLPSSVEHQFVQGFFWRNRIYISLNTNILGPQIFFAEAPLLQSDAVVDVSCRLTGNGNLQVLSSAHIRTPLSQSFMAVVFSRKKRPQHNALCVYNLEQLSRYKGAEKNQSDRTPLFNYPGLLSVSATLVQNWTVLFLGAEDGRLIKLVLDENRKVIRRSILTELRDESPIRHSILLDKVDPNYLYLLTERMVRRLKVASCRQYSSCEGCLSAQDPYCGWCILEERCSFRSECQEANWINIAKQADSCPKVTLKPVAIDHTLKKELQFTVTLKGSLGNVNKENGECMLITGNNEVICSGRYNTQCLCKLSYGNHSLLFHQTDPIINASVKFTSMNFVTSIKLHNCFKNTTSHGNNQCTECVNSGCHWCALEHRCSSSCEQPTNQACPRITHAKQSSNTSILISLENAKILENSTLKCIFNGTVEYEAKWVNDYAIQCPRPQFVEERRILPVNLAHAANSKNIIDNPNNITVYSCDVQKPNCVFCTPERNCTETVVTYINPDRVGPFGKSTLSIIGSNLNVGLSATLYVTGMADNIAYKSNNCIIENSTLVKCILPEAIHGKKSVCLLYDSEKECGANRTALLEYVTNIHVTSIHPAVSWLRGGRRMKIRGKNVDVLKEMKITVDHKSWINCSSDNGNWTCESPPLKTRAPGNHSVYFFISGSVQQVWLTYQENPKFYNFTTTVNENQLLITVMRKEDKLQLSKSELKIYVPRGKADPLECEIKDVTEDKIKCVLNTSDPSFSRIEVRYGEYIEHVINASVSKIPYIALAVILTMLVLFIAIYYYASHRKNKQFSQKLEAQMELLENQFRSQIREGFIELQTEGSDVYLINDYNSIPFLDYKHFAIRTFFPESASEHNEIKFVKDLINTTPQTEQRNSLKEGFNALYSFLNNKQFLVTLIHILEQQKDFTIKDRCRFASFLTIAFHSNLVHLTHVLDQLLKDLMDGSTAQPKLLLRRTETVVEKLLTNWVSLCMYGFLRESVGEPLFKLVSAIKQRISLGPVDAISGKALYTLNEDWLLWQVTDFESLKLDVSFQLNTEADIENDQDNDSGFELDVLNCDTIGQVKEKIFETFFNKYGYSQRFQKEDIDLEHVMNGTHRRLLQDIDQTTQVLEADVKKINTLSHYCIPNGASVVVVRRAKDSKPDTLGDESADNLCHLISPQSVLVESPVPEQGKQKVKVKEMYLTKLLSSKVALQPYVENLFRSIWSIQNSKAPIAIRHIFDILQAQAYNKKITDPDVLHIWKTNSLPLRFWINIIKNPQFVFDIEKTPHLDSCLSVIAQAFMDSFSLSSQHLGKHSPTNKVLYARDVPRYKEEVRNYYRQIADLGSLSKEEMENFLMEESQKHQNEFKEKDAMIELGKYIQKYSAQLESRTESESLQVMREAISEIHEYLHHKSSCTWE